MASPPKKPRNKMRTPRPNAGIAASYERQLRSSVRQMGQDYLDEIKRFYRDVPPVRRLPSQMGDGVLSGSVAIAKAVMERLRDRWMSFFAGQSRGLASEFIRQVSGYQGQTFRRLLREYQRKSSVGPRQEWGRPLSAAIAIQRPLPILGPSPTPEEEQEALEALHEHEATAALRNVGQRRENGWIGWENERLGPLPSLPSDLTPEGQERVKTIEEAAVEQNVGLIQSIPQQFHDRVAQDVLTALQDGWPLDDLVEKLRHSYGITRKRAVFIAADQNRAITARLNVAQALAAWGDDAEGVWCHVQGGEKQPRKSHVEAHGRRFRLSEGCWIDGEYILPGQKIGCRCWFEICPPGID